MLTQDERPRVDSPPADRRPHAVGIGSGFGGLIDWATQAEPYRQAVERRLAETLLPGLQDEIVTSRVTTPQDFHDRYRSIKGAAFSLAPTLLQSAWFRPNNRSEDVKGLYLVGAGTQPGAGLPGVLFSARILDALVPDAVLVR